MNKIKTSFRLLTLALTISLFLSSCGKSIEELSLKSSSNAVTGDLENYLEIVSQEIKIIPSSEYGKALEAKIKFKVNKSFPGMGETKGIDHISIDLLDNRGMPVSGLNKLKFDGWCCYDPVQNLEGLLKKGSGEFVATFYMETPYELIGEDFKKILAKKENDLKGFSVTSLISEKEKKSSNSDESSNSEDDTEVSSSGDENYDKVLDDYEAYVDKYLVFLKKANKGDMSAMQEYPALMEKAQDLEKSLKDAENQQSLSASQMKRMVKIQTKMLNAAIDMQK
ncbi:DUF6591 domain-containing protein [Riemerella anatipestifer]|uniref:DUF6591 domain-containing protein n=1 Tax=Riemerella anatipestifer TaxID=34085 RepID=UPI00129E5339|nr:DUF6591 domain-containing protein [Riemerella anatipestifer]MRM83106.1 hypothetical protein [Riemerella anatipestifer]